MTICHTNEFVQSPFSDGVLFYILWYIYKMATDGGGGVVDGERDDFKRGHWSGVKSPHLSHFFFNVKIDLYEFV